jgi:di/tricarboxylate transporter
MESSVILLGMHLGAFVQRSALKPKGDWLNWTIGGIVVVAVLVSLYWLTLTTPRRRRRKQRE